MIVSDKAKGKGFSIAPGVTISILLSGEKIMMILVELAEGSAVPMHSHPHEQMGMCLGGEAELQSEKGKAVIKEGTVYHLRGDEKHGVKALSKGGAVLLDVFSPPREDYLARV